GWVGGCNNTPNVARGRRSHLITPRQSNYDGINDHKCKKKIAPVGLKAGACRCEAAVSAPSPSAARPRFLPLKLKTTIYVASNNPACTRPSNNSALRESLLSRSLALWDLSGY
ncbi:unnamed protein product, partial [Ectocarpus sp. 12 AP-2014]